MKECPIFSLFCVYIWTSNAATLHVRVQASDTDSYTRVNIHSPCRLMWAAVQWVWACADEERVMKPMRCYCWVSSVVPPISHSSGDESPGEPPQRNQPVILVPPINIIRIMWERERERLTSESSRLAIPSSASILDSSNFSKARPISSSVMLEPEWECQSDNGKGRSWLVVFTKQLHNALPKWQTTLYGSSS